MIITSSYCWHIMLIVMGLLLQLLIVNRIYLFSARRSFEWNQIIDTRSRLSSESKFLNLFEEEDFSDEKIEFDINMKI